MSSSAKADAENRIKQKYGVGNPEAYAKRRIRATRMKSDLNVQHPAALRWASNTSVSGMSKETLYTPNVETTTSTIKKKIPASSVMQPLVY